MRKYIAGLIVFIMLINGAVMPSCAKEISETEENGKLAAGILSGIGVISGAMTGENVSRKDFVALAMKLGGYREKSVDTFSAKSPFSDVSQEIPEFEYLLAAYQLGYICGNEKGEFFPEEKISLTAACKILLAVLGYARLAENTGGYPTGYLSLAVKTGLMKGVYQSEFPNGYAVMQMALNALDANVFEISGYTGGDAIYTDDKHTLLFRSFKIKKTSGIVQTNMYTDLYRADSDLGKNRIRINDIVLKSDKDFSDLIGYDVDAYYGDEEPAAAAELVYAQKRGENHEVCVLPYDISSVELSQISAEYNGKIRKYKLSPNLFIIRNGKAAPLSLENLSVEYGDITLIDYNGDNTYEVAKVMQYNICTVSGISLKDKCIADENGKKILLDKDSSDYSARIFKGGSPAEFEDLKTGDVISYAESAEGEHKVKTAVLSAESVSGIIEEVGDNYLILSGTKYYCVDEVLKNAAAGKNAAFSLGLHNIIIKSQLQSSYVYGYLTNISKKNLNPLKCRIFTENNRWVNLNAKEKIRFNGVSVSADEFWRQIGIQPQEYRQLIRYRVNSSGEIAEINTAETYAPFSNEEDSAIKKDMFRMSQKINNLSYVSQLQSFEGSVLLSGDTIIFSIPDMTGEWNLEDFSVIKQSSLSADQKYNGYAYDADMVREARVCVLKEPYNTKINTDNSIGKFIIYSGMAAVLNKDKEINEAINGFMGGKEINLPVKSPEVLTELSPPLQTGDIIQVLFDTGGRVTQISRVFSSGTEKAIVNSLISPSTFITGEIKAADYIKNKFVVQYGDEETTAFSTNSGLSGIYIYNISRNTVTAAGVEDMLIGDRIFGGFRYLQAREIIILR